ncbi:MAG TPA: hypothetical protein VGC63_10510 [Solirubrobacterales bacterium]
MSHGVPRDPFVGAEKAVLLSLEMFVEGTGGDSRQLDEIPNLDGSVAMLGDEVDQRTLNSHALVGSDL